MGKERARGIFRNIPVKYGGQRRRRRGPGCGVPGDNTQKCAVVVCMLTVRVSF